MGSRNSKYWQNPDLNSYRGLVHVFPLFASIMVGLRRWIRVWMYLKYFPLDLAFWNWNLAWHQVHIWYCLGLCVKCASAVSTVTKHWRTAFPEKQSNYGEPEDLSPVLISRVKCSQGEMEKHQQLILFSVILFMQT